MSITQQPDTDTKPRDYIKGELVENKMWILGIILFIALWVFAIIFYLISIFIFLMALFSILYVLVLFYMHVRSSSNYSFVLDTIQNNPDLQVFNEKVKDLSDEQIEELIETIIEKE